jgi:C1A family cysteine protease
MDALVTFGPVSIFIAAGSACFNDYASGVLTPASCACYTGPNSLDHMVLVVGYGVSPDNVPYWLVQNQWGVNWGQEGFILLQRGVAFPGTVRGPRPLTSRERS